MNILINAPIVHLVFDSEDHGGRVYSVTDEDGNSHAKLTLHFNVNSMEWALKLNRVSGYFGAPFKLPRDCKDANVYTKQFLHQFLAKFNLDLRFDEDESQ